MKPLDFYEVRPFCVPFKGICTYETFPYDFIARFLGVNISTEIGHEWPFFMPLVFSDETRITVRVILTQLKQEKIFKKSFLRRIRETFRF